METADGPAGLRRALTGQLPDMVTRLEELVACESPSSDIAALSRCAELLDRQASDLWGVGPEWIRSDGRPHLCWQFGSETTVLVLGHLDTVWPMGTLADWPFRMDGPLATGPGCFDMKAGLVQGLHAVATLPDRSGLTVLVTSDEEVGSPTSRALIERLAHGARAALILEPSAEGALKTGRKGISRYEVEVSGRAAHAGLEPEAGANAALELAEQAFGIEALASPRDGTSVTPTTMSAGTSANTVPASAWMDVDVRVTSEEEQLRVDAAMRTLTPRRSGTGVRVTGGPNRPPMPEAASQDLLALARRCCDRLGLPPVVGVAVGGASDGNITAAAGVPTLDGLGAVGHGAHAADESVVVDDMPDRAALLAELLADLL
jgi:glutamate carboxypeptidase